MFGHPGAALKPLSEFVYFEIVYNIIIVNLNWSIRTTWHQSFFFFLPKLSLCTSDVVFYPYFPHLNVSLYLILCYTITCPQQKSGFQLTLSSILCHTILKLSSLSSKNIYVIAKCNHRMMKEYFTFFTHNKTYSFCVCTLNSVNSHNIEVNARKSRCLFNAM